MTFIEIIGQQDEATRQQRWSHLLTLIVAAAALLLGLNMRASALNATTPYTNVQAGIRAQYPQNWMIDESGDYIFRVRDMSRIGFKTTLLIQTFPVGGQTTERNILDTLNINRLQTLATYNPLSIENYILPDETAGIAMNYTFVDIESNPFLESVPVVVTGQDILTIRRGQAIVITFLADSQTYLQERATFERFLETLDFS